MTAGSVAWANMEYADTDVKAKSPRDTSKQDQFVVVEDGVVEVDVLDTKTNRRHTHTLWPKDFVYCNERPGAHPSMLPGNSRPRSSWLFDRSRRRNSP